MNNPPTDLCPDCQHPHHLPGTECETRVHHGRNFHVCLCLARPGAGLPCPPQMTCQGGTLGYTDIYYLQRGHSLSSADGVISPEVLRLDPTRAVPAGLVAVPPTTTDRAAVSAKLWEIAEHHIVAEWICCEPLDPKHDLCAQGYAALGMAKTLLVDSDPEQAWNPAAPVLDAVMAMLPQPADRIAAPTVWIDGHPQLEAIAAAVWERCRTEDTSTVVDDPRNIAVAAYAAVLAVLSAGSEDTTTTRAAVLRAEAALIRAHCPDHLDSNSADGSWISCHCDVADDMERRLAAETQPTEPPWATDGARIGRALIWSWARVGDTDFGHGYRTAQEDVRAILTRPLLGAEEQPEPEPDAPRREPHPTEADLRHALAVAAKFHGQDTDAPVHVGGGANAEDCPACKGATPPPYPWTCPGPDAAASAGVQTDEETNHG